MFVNEARILININLNLLNRNLSLKKIFRPVLKHNYDVGETEGMVDRESVSPAGHQFALEASTASAYSLKGRCPCSEVPWRTERQSQHSQVLSEVLLSTVGL